MRRDERVAAGSPRSHCKGRYGERCGAPSPSVRFTQQTTWSLGDWSGGYRWRFLAATEIDEALADLDGDGALDALCAERFCAIAATHYVDLHLEWAPADVRLLEGFRITLGVENVFDEDPPIVGSFGPPGSANTYPDTFDPLGRTFTLTVSKKF
jgi:outer membrane receptor protein involved in Fe transport